MVTTTTTTTTATTTTATATTTTTTTTTTTCRETLKDVWEAWEEGTITKVSTAEADKDGPISVTMSREGGDMSIKTQAWRVDAGTAAAATGEDGGGSGGDDVKEDQSKTRSRGELLEELPWQVIGIMSDASLSDLRAKKRNHDQEIRDRLGIPAHVPVHVYAEGTARTDEPPKFKIGDRVEVLWEGEHFDARVTAVHSNGKVDVLYGADNSVGVWLSEEEHELTPLSDGNADTAEGEEVVEEDSFEASLATAVSACNKDGDADAFGVPLAAAEASWTQALLKAQVLTARAECFRRQSEAALALADAEAAVELTPMQPAALKQHALALLDSGRPDDAVKAFELLLGVDRQHPGIFDWLLHVKPPNPKNPPRAV